MFDFLSRLEAAATQREEWPGASLHVEAYLTSRPPSSKQVSSARCLVLRGYDILLQTDITREHITPGGRLEANETSEDAMRREVLEETGWSLGASRFLGLLRFRHLAAVPKNYPHPYPEFLQAVYTAPAKEFFPHCKLDDRHELGTRFLDYRIDIELPLTPCESAFLKAAIRDSP